MQHFLLFVFLCFCKSGIVHTYSSATCVFCFLVYTFKMQLFLGQDCVFKALMFKV